MTKVAVVTGSRADYGLLRPICRAIERHRDLTLELLVTGTHLLPPDHTLAEVEADFSVSATIPMQAPGREGRVSDALAFARGTDGFARRLAEHAPDYLLVLGDRIEAFAAACVAAIAGVRVAHVHGGDRAEGIADESLRHATTKLAHVHFTASVASTERVIAMGEEPERTHFVGSPAIDDLASIPPLADDVYVALGRPEILFLLHPTGDEPALERAHAALLLNLALETGRVLALEPNHDAGRSGIVEAIATTPGLASRSHLDRRTFVGLLKRVMMIVGNSSAGLIECAALPTRCINVGRRQAGRQLAPHVINVPVWDAERLRLALAQATREPLPSFRHPFGAGEAGRRIAHVLAQLGTDGVPITKRNSY